MRVPGTATHAASRDLAAAQELVAKPGLRLILAHVADEAGIRQEVVDAPFPVVTEHLPQPEHSVALEEGRYARGSQ